MGFALEHLSEARRIEIARELFKIKGKPTARGELIGLCPFHEEKNPSFSYNFKKDEYNCFSCAAAGDLIKLWAHVHCPGMDEKEAFKAFCTEFDCHSHDSGKPENKGGPSPALILQMKKAWAMFPPLPDIMIKKLEKERGWDPQRIKSLDLRLETHQLNKAGEIEEVQRRVKIAIPIVDAAGELVNIRLYHHGAKHYKLLPFGSLFGSGLGMSRLFPSQLSAGDKQPVILCEGESDTICALSHDLNAITQTSRLRFDNWPKQHKAVFAGRDVFIAYDADEPGQKYASHAAQALQGVAKSVRMIQWPDYMLEDGKIAKKHGQDLTDFFVKHGKTNDDFFELIKNAPLYDPEKDPYRDRDSAEATSKETPVPRDFFARGINDRLSYKPRLLAQRLQDDMKLLSDPETGLIFKFNGKYWDNFDEDQIRKIAIQHLGDESQKSRAEDAVYQVKMLSTIPFGRKLNDREDWICIQNGMLNVVTFEMKSYDPDFLSTYMLPVALDPESKKRCNRWEKFLAQTIQTAGPIAQAMQFAGYCFVRHTKYDKCLFLLGPGEDGKSVFLKILQELVGHENCAAVSFKDLEDQFHRSGLFHKLLNVSTEIGATAIDSPYFKAIATGDTINAAFKHQDIFSFKPYCKMAFAGNSMPRVRDNSHGFFRRFLPIEFKRQFKEDDPERDPDLLDKLKEELPEIFYYALCSLKSLTEQKMFTNCDETKRLMMKYRRSNNPVLCFVEDECTLNANESVAKADLYKSYKEYCKEGGYMALNNDNFFRELYAAINNLQAYRPREGEERVNKIKGITLGVDITPEEGKG